MTREEPYALISRAAKRGWVRFAPPRDLVSENRIRERYRQLQNVQVVHSARIHSVAQRGAEVLLHLVSRYAQRRRPRKVVRIGFAGGRSVGLVARLFAELLAREKIPLPEKISLHSLVAGFDPFMPATDPNTFFSFFLDESSLRVKTEFVSLLAPPVVRHGDIENLMRIPQIRDAREAASSLDVIVTSGSEWKDDHSPLKRCMQSDRRAYELLNELDCVGDILWRPMNAAGPIEVATPVRALTLVELSDLPRRIERGANVLLMLGPCGVCRRDKGRLLRTIVDHEDPLVTHLVADTRSVATILPDAEADQEEEKRAHR